MNIYFYFYFKTMLLIKKNLFYLKKYINKKRDFCLYILEFKSLHFLQKKKKTILIVT